MNLATVWTVLFKEPSRYNWLLQYYLCPEGVTLSWVGTGRCLCSMDFATDDYQDLQAKLLDAARRMKSDGRWLTAEYSGREKTASHTGNVGKSGAGAQAAGELLCRGDAAQER